MSPTQTLNRPGEGKWENPENGPLLENQFGPGVDQVCTLHQSPSSKLSLYKLFYQAGPDNTNTIHLIAKEGTKMDKTGEPNAENENAVRLLIENGCRIDLQTDSYQEYFQKKFFYLSKKNIFQFYFNF